MAKNKATAHKRFKLSNRAQAKLNNYLDQIRRGIVHVCEMHSHDSNPSLKQDEFEGIYIDKLLGMTAKAVRVTLKGIADGLAAQKERELQAIMQDKEPDEIKEDIK